MGDPQKAVSKISRFSEELENPPLPNADHDYNMAKRFLQKMDVNEESVWELLTKALQKVGEFSEEVSKENFQKIIRALRRKAMNREPNHFYDFYERTASWKDTLEACTLVRSLKYRFDIEERLPDPNTNPDPFTLKKAKLLNEAGMGLSDNETYYMLMSMKRITENFKLGKARIWGKIFGLERDYYVIEVDPSAAAIETAQTRDRMLNRETKALLAMAKKEEAAALKAMAVAEVDVEDKMRGMKEEVVAIKESIVSALAGPDLQEVQLLQAGIKADDVLDPIKAQQLLVKYVMPPIPQPPPFEEVVVPSETLGKGVNSKQYFVASQPWGDYVLLENATPAHIVTSRCIHKVLTGNLDAPVDSFPSFPGVERHLLRALIARISAGTIVCPLGFYMTQSGEEEMLNEEDMLPGGIFENPDYKPQPLKRLVDSLRNHWMHIRQYILPQGRTTFWKKQPEGEFEAWEDWDEEELRGRLGPPPLTLISRDDSPDLEKCWSVRRSFRTMGLENSISVRSNVWPGAGAVTRGYLWENIYIGWAVKYLANPYSPPPTPGPWDEYELGPEIMEKADPTPEEEEAWRQRHRPPAAPERAAVGGEGEGEGEGGDEDEDA